MLPVLPPPLSPVKGFNGRLLSPPRLPTASASPPSPVGVENARLVKPPRRVQSDGQVVGREALDALIRPAHKYTYNAETGDWAFVKHAFGGRPSHTPAAR